MTKGRDADFPIVTSDTSIASIAGFNGPSFGACAVRGFRGAGVADTNAARTVRRCTPCRSARARIERSSRRASRRIASNSSALLDPNGPPHHRRPIIHPDPRTPAGGATYDRHTTRSCCHVGPDTTVTKPHPPTPGGARYSRHTGAS